MQPPNPKIITSSDLDFKIVGHKIEEAVSTKDLPA